MPEPKTEENGIVSVLHACACVNLGAAIGNLGFYGLIFQLLANAHEKRMITAGLPDLSFWGSIWVWISTVIVGFFLSCILWGLAEAAKK